jgi:hypothetical protein
MKRILLPLLLTLCVFNLSAQYIHIQEDFNAATLPTGWTTNAVTGSFAWSFGIDGSTRQLGNDNIDGTSMAYFDDDGLGFGAQNNRAVLLSPTFDNFAFSSTILTFDYNFRDFMGFGAPVPDSFYVEVFGGINWQTVFSVSTDDCGIWNLCIGNFPKASIDISQYANASCQVRFTYFDGNDFSYYAGIENVEITSILPIDLGIYQINSPNTSCNLSAAEVLEIELVNYGTDTISLNIPITFDVDSGSQIYVENVTGLIFPSDTLNYTFFATADLSAVGAHDAKVYLSGLSNDTAYQNDTLVKTLFNDSLFSIPFTDDFEGASNWRIEGTNSSWQLGIPLGSTIDTAFSGTNSFVTNLSGDHNNDELSFLYSPCFDISQIQGAPIVTFRLNHVLQLNADNVTLESSTDGGNTWNKVEPELGSVNWHALNSVWEGNSLGWLEVRASLRSLIGINTVKFRFRFESNNSITNEGVGIDDFSVTESDSIALSLNELLNPSISAVTSCGMGAENFVVSVTNEGLKTIDSVFFFYQINNGVIVRDTTVANLPQNRTETYTLNSKFDFSALMQYDITVWAKAKGDLYAKNDSIVNVVIQNTRNAVTYTMPYEETFSLPNFVPGTATRHSNDIIDSNWIRTSTTANYSWRTANSVFNSILSTGPALDHTGGGSSFLYAAASTRASNRTITLESPCIDLANSREAINLEYWYHRYGANEPLQFEVLKVSDGVWRTLEIISATPQASAYDPWTKRILHLDTFQGEKIKIRFKLNSVSRFSETAVDDLSIYDLAQFDLKIRQISNPTSSCNPSDSITVTIFNNGSDSITSVIPLQYQINNRVVINDSLVLSTPLLRGDSVRFTFNTVPNFSTPSSRYNLKVWTNLLSDQIKQNDTLLKEVLNQNLGVNQFVETFDSFTDGSCLNVANANVGDVLLNNWIEKSPYAFSWHVQDGVTCNGTASATTGPSVDHTSGKGNFLFTEASGAQRFGVPDSESIAILESPCIDFSNKPTAGLRFWYHRYGATMGNFYIDVFANGIWNLAIDSLIGQSQVSSIDPWKLKKVFFNQFSGQIINVRFRAIYGGGFEEDMAIDDVEFYSPIQQDAKLMGIDLLQASCEQDSAQLILEVNNFGLDSILPNQLKVNYQINGGVIVSDSNMIGISVDSNLTFLMNVPNSYNSNNQTITAWVELFNDSNSFNDTLIYTIDLPFRAPEYTEGFEDIVAVNGQCGNYNTLLNLAWQIDANDQWVAGHDTLCNYGNNGATPTPLTGPDSAYAGNGFMYFEPGFNSILDTANLLSTCIDLTSDSLAYLDFMYHMYGAGTGNLYVDVVSNGVWSRIDSIVGPQQFAHNDPWSKRIINLNQFAGNVIRVRFTAIESTNTSISDEGAISIDDVRISNSFPVSINEISTSNSFQLFPNPTNGEFILRGKGSATSELTISLVDLNGRLIESRTVDPISNSINERFDLSNQANGVYLISIQSEGQIEVKKLVKN